MTHIVVLGGGIGGVSMAYDMRAICSCEKEMKITVISESPTFHFVPSNPWVGVNWRKRGQIEVSLEKYLKRKDIDFIPVAARKVHPEQNEIELVDDRKISYDYLVIATGPKLAFEAVNGLGPQANTQSICHVDHAEKAGDAWKGLKENPGPVVVGAVQGVSCFGPAYEYAFIMHHDLKKAKIRHRVPMTYVTSEPYIGHLGLGGVGDSKGMLESKLRERDIKWICNAKVDKIEKDVMYVTEYDDLGKKKQEHTLPFAYSMMMPPFTGVDAVMGIPGLVNEKGFVLIDEYQRNPSYHNIFAVGVCVAIAPLEKTPVPVGVPKTGYMIESMVAATAHNIKDLCHGREPSHKATWNTICLADMGDTGVAFVALPQNPPRNVAWMKGGQWVHWMKIMFEWYFLHKVKSGSISPLYEKYALRFMGIRKRQFNKLRKETTSQ
ncbi:MAG: NAD(P)/FAD-dependent oxidoreductase [Rhodospirillales bacterium]|nr:NAD(P)/FAD-dependent oxidoreductase [Rhodospirillales bacterium]MCB9965274.1 NAD(P)/FAD-dependent oxidoreductase [Rhodospirillales bacterium]MCB9972956.1 NAD(P)/FAD-dependent oxidoreductase [Rhodospirillales bacterium]